MMLESLGLVGLPLLSRARTRSISPENPTGEPGGGGRAEPGPGSPARQLGPGWKARPSVRLEPGVTVLAEMEGPGVVQHIWMTTQVAAYRDCVLRVFWDGEAEPSIEVPLGDFFCNGHGLRYPVSSLPIVVNSSGGFNSYWPMPFRQQARIEVMNESDEPVPELFYQVTYALDDVPDETGAFHAQWRRSTTSREHPEHVLLDGVRGQGHVVGTFLAWAALGSGWWGEGEVKAYLDEDADHPTICGTGTEDYAGGAWCFADGTYSTPFLGYPLRREVAGEVSLHALYRWHIPDPIRFERSLRMTVQALGWWPDGTFQPRQDDIASVVYWYQREPHAPFPLLPSGSPRGW